MVAHSTAKDTAPNPKKTQTPAPDLHDPSLYVNRELGLLSFQWRVLEEARDANPNIRCEGDNAYPLHFAVEKHRLPIIRLLVEHGADTIGEGDYHELGVIGWATAWDYIQPNPERS